MHGGHVVEVGPVEAILEEPKHPYTQRLVGSVLRADRRVEVTARLPGDREGVDHTTAGCRYAGKCEYRFAPCADIRPALLTVGSRQGHVAMCHLYDETYALQRRAGEQRAASR
jgi:oligopeptide/dipeptide ABC transporter ATP-binding protein